MSILPARNGGMISAGDLNFGTRSPSVLGNLANSFGFQDQGSLVQGMIPDQITPMDIGQIGVPAQAGMQVGMPQQANPLGSPLGANLGTAQVAISGLQALSNLWMGFQANKLAKKQFKAQQGFADANFVNSMKSYNTALSDRARSRGFTESQSQSSIDSYIENNKMVDTRKG